MKVIIAGGRDFDRYALLEEKCSEILFKYDNEITYEIVSGCAEGADHLGQAFADSYALPVKRFPANWSKFGKAAGPIRNAEMADYADMLIAFWDGKSKGTANMINVAKAAGLKVHIINY